MRIAKLESLSLVYVLICTVAHSFETERKNVNVKSLNMLITSEAECEILKVKAVVMDPDTEYRVQMGLLNSSCSTNPELKGFNCKLTFHQTDSLALVGSQICVDLQGVPQTMPDTQLSFTVFNQQQKLKEVYATSRLLPEGIPFYICSGESKNALSVSLSVRDSVKMCPYIMSKMVGHNISLGTVMMRPTLPTYILSMENCSSAVITKENAYILKVTSKGHSLFCGLKILQNHSYSNTNSCIELIYVSLDYSCEISVELSRPSQSLIRFYVPLGNSFPTMKARLFCKFDSSTDNEDLQNLVLVIQKNTSTPCFGDFAISTTFTESNYRAAHIMKN